MGTKNSNSNPYDFQFQPASHPNNRKSLRLQAGFLASVVMCPIGTAIVCQEHGRLNAAAFWFLLGIWWMLWIYLLNWSLSAGRGCVVLLLAGIFVVCLRYMNWWNACGIICSGYVGWLLSTCIGQKHLSKWWESAVYVLVWDGYWIVLRPQSRGSETDTEQLFIVVFQWLIGLAFLVGLITWTTARKRMVVSGRLKAIRHDTSFQKSWFSKSFRWFWS